MFFWVSNSSFAFQRQGISHYQPLTTLPVSTSLGPRIYVLELGRFSPDEGVEFYIYSGSQILEVQVALDQSVQYSETRNGIFYMSAFPDKYANITLSIRPLCNACKWDGLESVDYTLYSRFPYYELKILIFACWTSGVVVLLAYYFRGHLVVKRLLALIVGFVPPILLLYLAWYLFAFDKEQWWAAVLAGAGWGLAMLYSVVPKR
jgi:hypothetical protein